MKAFETKHEAVKETAKQNVHFERVKIFHKHGDKRKRSWFVGTYMEWLNK